MAQCHPFLFERMKHGAHYVVVSPVDLGIVAVRVNAPELACRAVFDVPLTSFKLLRAWLQFQQVVILGGLSYEVRAGIIQGLDLMHV